MTPWIVGFLAGTVVAVPALFFAFVAFVRWVETGDWRK